MSIFSKIKDRLPKVFKKVSGLFKKGILKPIKKRFSRKTIKRIPETHRDELQATKEAYKPVDERSERIDGHFYDRSLSNKRTAVYVNDNMEHIILAFRGTVPSNLRDLLSDSKIFLEDFKIRKDEFKKSKYMKEARKAYKSIRKKYGDIEITITGHSLAGRVSIQLAKELNEDSVSFNAGGGDFGTNQINNLSVHYRAPKDPISIGFATDARTITVDKDKKGINHTIEYFK